ncbi:chemotaxis protein CheW [Clostridium felsineum]|uniref:Chemotaxis protein CheW n=1 Tax=Clostridium felsineum TaxID=36839 RepID=A0A1S8M871_9CLOT|nr:chemotaxis protein CheW [Clostridium felsineum]URZ00996.1 Chemotaxis protein CheW [Clostridium felsineum]URZ06254.1 Chemotaxis protein CheW [Clostridium felsineum]URZ11289.1 Chemotaxis protein CheW [Clostridium felsineum]
MSDGVKILIFVVGEEYYAADIVQVERILGHEMSTKLPDVPEFVNGVINYEGGILPVVSLAKRFSLKEKEISDETKVIVSKIQKEKIGIIVDLVSEVRDIESKDIEDQPNVISGISKRYIKGLIKVDGKIVIFLDISKILTDEEKELL